MNSKKASRIQVSERALLARINRKLRAEELVMKKCKSDSHCYNDLGDYYEVNMRLNSIGGRHINDLEKYGRELGVLKPYEALAE